MIHNTIPSDGTALELKSALCLFTMHVNELQTQNSAKEMFNKNLYKYLSTKSHSMKVFKFPLNIY